MIREKLTINVSGKSRIEINNLISAQVAEYLNVDSADVEKFVDIELDICAEEEGFSATAYVKVKTNA